MQNAIGKGEKGSKTLNDLTKEKFLDELDISIIPESIQNLNSLKYLNVNNNRLETLPTTLCKIYSNLTGFDLRTGKEFVTKQKVKRYVYSKEDNISSDT